MKADLKRTITNRRFEGAAYGKVNLRLKVCGRRPDGYHLLSMLNAQVELADEVSICLHVEGPSSIVVEGAQNAAELSDLERNIASRAAQRYLAACNSKLHFSIDIHKRIPQGGGMGGGSADAGLVLSLLHAAFRECGGGLSEAALLELAAALGADVPYALTGGAALVSGIGEKVEHLSLSDVDGVPVLLFLPEEQSITAEVYARFRERFPDLAPVADERAGELRRLFAGALSSEDRYEALLCCVENDFEQLLPDLLPRVWTALEVARSDGRLRVGLTGSGSIFFGLPRNRGSDIDAVSRSLQPKLARFGVQTLSTRLRTVRYHF